MLDEMYRVEEDRGKLELWTGQENVAQGAET
jgi:hypothetical protein